jgi:carbon storage regulator
MLILARRAGESIFLGDDVEIRIVEVSPSRVKIGVIAPRELAVLRGEMKRTAEQNLVAAKPAGSDAVARLLAHLRGT